MYSRLSLTLESDSQLTCQRGSSLQGVLFRNVDHGYAAQMHEQSLHPYSQYLYTQKGYSVWCVQTLTDDAFEHMILPLLAGSFCQFTLNGNTDVRVVHKDLEQMQEDELVDKFANVDISRHISLEFCSPTAFKQNGTYNILSEPRLIMRSLLAKYCEVSHVMMDESVLDEFDQNIRINRYRLSTLAFPVGGGTSVTGFMGTLGFHVSGDESTCRLVQMLLNFGEYSGVGVKTGMGMGGMRIYRGDEKDKG